MSEKEFIAALKEIGIVPTELQLEQLEQYYQLLISWNERINLTGITEKEQVYLKHFYDSATLNTVIDLNEETTLCDIGTGAGFPGIVLKILFPNLKVTLIDSLQKRIHFLEEVVNNLKLTNIEIIHARAEEYARTNRECFDVVTARAVAPLNVLLEYCIPLVKVGKYFVPMKANISREILESQGALRLLGSSITLEKEFFLPIENSKRTILLIKKEHVTNCKYPRKFSDIKKKPLS